MQSRLASCANITSPAVFAGLAGVSIALSAPVSAQIHQAPVVQTSPLAAAAKPTGVVADPNRVYGDDAPVFAGLGVFDSVGMNISASLVTQYSDNVARVSGDFDPAGRYRSKNDWTFRPEVGVSFNRPLGRQSLFLTASAGRVMYARNTALNSNRYSLGGGANLALGNRCGGGVQAGYSNRDTQIGNFEEVIPSSQQRVSMGASVSCRTVGGLSATLGYNYGKTSNETDDPLGLIDRSFANVETHNVNGSLGYAIGPRAQLGVQGSWGKNRFPNQLLPTGGVNENTVKSGSIFAAYRMGSSLSANASIGKSEVSSGIGGSTFSGTTWNGGLTYSGPRLGANVTAGRNVSGGSGGSANYSVGSFLNGTVSYSVNERASLSTGFSTSNSTYRGFFLLPETIVVNSSRAQRYFLGADYRLNRLLSFSADFNHLKRSSRPSTFNYNENSIVLGIRAKF